MISRWMDLMKLPEIGVTTGEEDERNVPLLIKKESQQ